MWVVYKIKLMKQAIIQLILWFDDNFSPHSIMPQVKRVVRAGEFGQCSSNCYRQSNLSNQFFTGYNTHIDIDINNLKAQYYFYLICLLVAIGTIVFIISWTFSHLTMLLKVQDF